MAAAKITSGVEDIGPEEAKRLLATMSRNRPLKMNHVAKLLHDAKCGEWHMNGEPIIISRSGHLIEGQHRMHMVMHYGKALPFLVVRGIDDECFRSINTGRSRTAADVLFMGDGVTTAHDATVLAAALRWVWKWESGSIYSQGVMPGERPAEPRPREILDLSKKHPKLIDSVEWMVGKRALLPGLQPSPAAFCHYIICKVHQADGRTFFGKLISGANLDETDAIYRLRHRIAQHSISSRKMTGVEFVALTFKAWNLFRAGEKVSVLSWRTNEDFPVPK